MGRPAWNFGIGLRSQPSICVLKRAAHTSVADSVAHAILLLTNHLAKPSLFVVGLYVFTS